MPNLLPVFLILITNYKIQKSKVVHEQRYNSILKLKSLSLSPNEQERVIDCSGLIVAAYPALKAEGPKLVCLAQYLIRYGKLLDVIDFMQGNQIVALSANLKDLYHNTYPLLWSLNVRLEFDPNLSPMRPSVDNAHALHISRVALRILFFEGIESTYGDLVTCVIRTKERAIVSVEALLLKKERAIKKLESILEGPLHTLELICNLQYV